MAKAKGGRGRAEQAAVPRAAALYGAAGLIPFVVCALAVWVAPIPWNAFALDIQLYYGATILSFLGAAHWGLALAGYGARGDSAAACTPARLGWSVAPALVAWLSLIMVPLVGVTTQIVAFAAVFFGDLRAVKLGLAPAWYPRLRRPLTAVVLIALGVSLLRVLWQA